jgi:IS605 OrfB family transposase
MTTVKLREWRGAKPVAGPRGVALTTRLHTSDADERVLDAVAAHLGQLRRGDLASVSRPHGVDPGLDAVAKRRAGRHRLNSRKGQLTAASSARWASAIIGVNDEQYRLARDAQYRHIIGLRAAIVTIEKRLAQPTSETRTREQHEACKRTVKGYASQAERFAKQRRLQSIRAQLRRIEIDSANRVVHVTEGGKRLAKTRHNLSAANLTTPQWRERWDSARYRVAANGSRDEPFGNLTITVTPAGQVSVRLPKPLEHLANAKRGRYVLSDIAVFSYRADEWLARITGGQSVRYTITRKPGRAGRYLTAAWTSAPAASVIVYSQDPNDEAQALGPVVGVDLNADHLAVRRLDVHGNPVGQPERIDVDLTGHSARRDAQVRHAITRLLHYTRRRGVDTIAVEDLDFLDARTVGRETMGRGQHGKRFRKTVTSIPTAVFRNRLAAQTSRHGIRLLAVNPAYTSAWGDQHWRAPYSNVTRHQAAATVIGRRAQGFRARRRDGVTRTRPEDRAVRATNQAAPESPQAMTSGRHPPGTRGTESRPPRGPTKRALGRATVTPALANNGQPLQVTVR